MQEIKSRIQVDERWIPTRRHVTLESQYGEPAPVEDIGILNGTCVIVTQRAFNQWSRKWEQEHWPDIYPGRKFSDEFDHLLTFGAPRPEDKPFTHEEYTQALLDFLNHPKLPEYLHLPEDRYPPRPQSEEEQAYWRFITDWHRDDNTDSRDFGAGEHADKLPQRSYRISDIGGYSRVVHVSRPASCTDVRR